MLIDATKYIWSKWQQPVFTDNETWGTVSATSVHKVTDKIYEPWAISLSQSICEKQIRYQVL